MTNSTTVKAVSDGSSGSGVKDPVADLRTIEAKALTALACEAGYSMAELLSQLHKGVYQPGTVSATELQRRLLGALSCMETADRYLHMLDDVLPDVCDADNAEPDVDR